MDRLRKWWRPALFLIALVALAQTSVSLLARTHRLHNYLVTHLERAFGRSVGVRHFTVLLLPSPVLEAEQVTIGEDPSFGNEYFLRADRLTAGLRWSGLLRGHFEFGTLSLTRPSLILVRNDQGNWNLERWLPPAKTAAGDASRIYGPQPPQTPSNRLQKIEIDDGRVNFKLLDEKLPFAFLGVSGSVEQVSSGRWTLALEAQPWRSGVTLQSTGTLVVRGDVAGTSARLQPAEVHVHWDQVSLADLFRLFRGQDYGLRGVFTLDGTAKSGAAGRAGPSVTQPGDWNFAVHAHAGQIHRWDLTERSDNPGANLSLEGRWNTLARNAIVERLALETAKSNLRGSARFTSNTTPSWEVRVESAGIQAADLLNWFRAFDPNINDAITAEQFFTGAVTLSGWPLELRDAAFSSFGGEVHVPGLSSALRIGAFQGGRGRSDLGVTPIRIAYAPLENAAVSAGSTAARRRAAPENKNVLDVEFFHDFIKHAGSASIDGHVEKVEDVLKVLAAFGRPINRGWDLTGGATTALRYQWDIAQPNPRWNGHIDFNKGALQVAGMNQPLQVNKARLDWHDGLRTASISDLDAFGGNWTGQLTQANVPDSDGSAKWSVQLRANHLNAADLDRWIGPRARPSWLQRMLSSLLGSTNTSPAASDLVRRVNAEGELRVDEFTLEKIKLTKLRAEGALHDLHLELRQVDGRCAGGILRARMRAAFLPRPSYDVSADLDRVDLAQLPAPASLPERFAGFASGTLHLTTQGVGREELLQRLAGKGEVKLRDVEFRGWDVSASMADGAPREGASRWAAGQGAFVIRDRGISLPGLRLDSGSDLTLIKGTVSFAQESDLTIQTLLREQDDSRLPEQGYVLRISGPLDLPHVSVERLIARRPAD
jgi:AsmA family/AsmA-like C-terminal region